MELSLICLTNLLKNIIFKTNKKKIIKKDTFSNLNSFCKFSTLSEINHKNISIKIKNTKKKNLLFLKKIIRLFKLAYKFIILNIIYEFIIQYIIYEIIIKNVYKFITQYIKYIILYIVYNDISFSNFFFNFINNNKKITNFFIVIKNFTCFYNENNEYFKLNFN